MTDDELEERWQRRLAARREVEDAACVIIDEIAEMVGGAALIEGTIERAEILRFVWRRPEHRAAIKQALRSR